MRKIRSRSAVCFSPQRGAMGRERASQALSDHASDAMTIYTQLTSSVLRGAC